MTCARLNSDVSVAWSLRQCAVGRVFSHGPRSINGKLADPGVPLFITESPLKADAAVSAGLVCIAVLGVLRLTVDLYSEALADPSHDARYLRFWSVLETLSGARIAGNRPVVRIDGTPWPQGGNTTQAAPRVYQYLADWLGVRAVDEHNLAGPANDLYEAVRGWYARRNATGHYGRFQPADPIQQSQGWFRRASTTVPPAGAFDDEWIRALQSTVEAVLSWELTQVRIPLLP